MDANLQHQYAVIADALHRAKKRKKVGMIKQTAPICPECKVQPVRVNQNGAVFKVCATCHAKNMRKGRLAKNIPKNPMCAKCNDAPRHVTNTGRVHSYCTGCKNELARETYRKTQLQLEQAL